jgi:hypothetical protein
MGRPRGFSGTIRRLSLFVAVKPPPMAGLVGLAKTDSAVVVVVLEEDDDDRAELLIRCCCCKAKRELGRFGCHLWSSKTPKEHNEKDDGDDL